MMKLRIEHDGEGLVLRDIDSGDSIGRIESAAMEQSHDSRMMFRLELLVVSECADLTLAHATKDNAVQSAAMIAAETCAVDEEGESYGGLCDWISNREGKVTARDLNNFKKTRFPSIHAARKALNRLASASLGEWRFYGAGPTGGRPTERFVLSSLGYESAAKHRKAVEAKEAME